MESDSLARFAAAAASTRRHHQPRYGAETSREPTLRGWRDLFLGFEEVDAGEDDTRAELPCPFCAEDFDAVGLCCHIDEEHPVEAKNGVCAICAARVGVNLVGHMMTQHGNFFKMYRKRRNRKGFSGSQSMLSLLRKDAREGNLPARLGGSSFVAPPGLAPDPLLSALIYTLPTGDSSKDVQPESFEEGNLIKKMPDEKFVDRVEPTLSHKDQEERAQRSEFVVGLVVSTIFDDSL